MTLDSAHLVECAYALALASIGWRCRSRQGEATTESELLGDRRIPWWAVLLSVLGSEISALTLIGVPASAFTGNWTYLQVVIGALLGRWLVARFFVPAFYRHNVVSIYEFLRSRYGPWTRSAAVLVFLCSRVLMSGVRLCAGAGVMAAAFGLDAVQSTLLLSVVGLLFCAGGGIRAVVWTETLQMSVMVLGVLATLGVLLARFGWPQAPAESFQVFNFSTDPRQVYTFWSALFGFTLFNTAVFGTDYDMAQRALTARNAGQSRYAVVGSALAEIPVFLTLLLIGTLLRQVYAGPDAPPADQVFTRFITTELPGPLRGLLVAAVISVVLSTYESALTALAGSFVIDVVRPVLPAAGEAALVRANRLATFGFAVLLVSVALASRNVKSLLNMGLEVGTYSAGSLLAIFLMALIRRPDQPAGHDRWTALVALPGSILCVVLLKQTTTLAFPWFVAFGTALALSLVALGSWLPPLHAPRPPSAEHSL